MYERDMAGEQAQDTESFGLSYLCYHLQTKIRMQRLLSEFCEAASANPMTREAVQQDHRRRESHRCHTAKDAFIQSV